VIRFRFVQDHQTDWPVKRMCELVELPRSSWYAWASRTPTAREIADAELLETIRDIYKRSRRTYGSPRVLGQLRRRGMNVSGKRVARLMRVKSVSSFLCKRSWSGWVQRWGLIRSG